MLSPRLSVALKATLSVAFLPLILVAAAGCGGSGGDGDGGVPVNLDGLGGPDEDPVVNTGDGPVRLDPSRRARVSSADGTGFAGGRLVVSLNGTGQTSDFLAVADEGVGASEIGVTGSMVTYGGSGFGSVAGGSMGADLSVELQAGASGEVVEALIGALTFENTDEDPLPPARNLTVRLHHPSGSTATAGVGLRFLPFALGQLDTLSDVRLKLGARTPQFMVSDGTRLFASSYFNNRVLIWNEIPESPLTPPDVVLGQPDFQTFSENTGGISASSLRHPVGIAVAGGKLFVSDVDNHRVLIWNEIPTANGAPADVVVGQPDMVSGSANAPGSPTAQSFRMPNQVHVANGRLHVADFENHRVLIWDSVPTSNGQAADVVLGQPDMTTGIENGGGISASTMSFPAGVTSAGNRLYVADYFNHRILAWDLAPSSNGVAADLVLGQPDMVSNTENNGGVSASSLFRPFVLDATDTELFAGDFYNSRILRWNVHPTVNQQPADVVIGQPDMVTGTPNTGGISAATLDTPVGVHVSGGRLFAGDRLNHRFMIWNSVPTTNGEPADVVLGQPDFTSNTENQGIDLASMPTSLSGPGAVATNGEQFAVCDTGQNRVLIWNEMPDSWDAPADVVVGQAAMDTGASNVSGVDATTLFAPEGVVFVGGGLAVADTGNHRILLFDQVPSANGASADHVLGQLDMTNGLANAGGAVGAATLQNPAALASDGTRLVVADRGNHRVLIFDQWPTADGAAADLVLGQQDMASAVDNSGGLGASSLSSPLGVAAQVGGLAIFDTGNHRVLVFDGWPTTDFEAADVVLGQPGPGTAGANQGGLGSASLSGVYGGTFFLEDGTLGMAVADTDNHRVLVWDTVPAASGAAADHVIGQSDFASAVPNGSGLKGRTMQSPSGVAVSDGVLFVCDPGNDRVTGIALP